MTETPELCAPEASEGASGNQDSSGLTPEPCQELKSYFKEEPPVKEDSPLKLEPDLSKELTEDVASKQELERPSEGEPREQDPEGEEMTLEQASKKHQEAPRQMSKNYCRVCRQNGPLRVSLLCYQHKVMKDPPELPELLEALEKLNITLSECI